MSTHVTLIDEDGVPMLVQRLLFRHTDLMFVAQMFDGDILEYPAEQVAQGIDLSCYDPTPEQWADARVAITRLEQQRRAKAVAETYTLLERL